MTSIDAVPHSRRRLPGLVGILAIGVAGLLAATGPSMAGDPTATVHSFYVPEVWNPLDTEDFSVMTGPALELFERNAKESEDSGEPGCIDFVVSVGAQDYDQAEIKKTISTEETAILDDGTAIVTARFEVFGESKEMSWTLQEVDGDWKVSDIESIADGWKLSEFPCQ